MRTLLSILAATVVIAARSHPAFAAGAVVGRGEQAPVVSGARMAVALTPGRTTRWMQVTVSGNQGGFLWLVPVAPGARVDRASDAWLDALDDATAPTILPPSAQPPCDAGVSVEQLGRAPAPPSSPVVGSGVALDPATLAALVAAGGGALSVAQAAAFAPVFQAGLDVVVLDFDATTSVAVTHTVQIVEGVPRSLDLPATGGGALYTEATVFVLASGRADIGPVPLTLDPAAILWGADGRSTYASRRTAALDAASGEAWLTDNAMADRLFASLQTPGAPDLPGVLHRYFELAAVAGDTSLDPASCDAVAATLSGDDGPLAALCPSGQLATAPGASPCFAAAADAGTAAALTCGPGATDAAFALAGLSPGVVWLTRSSGLLLPDRSLDPAVSVTSGAPVPAAVTAPGFDPSCGPPAEPAPPAGTSGSPSSATSSSSSAGSAGSAIVDTTQAVAVAASSSDGCDGSSSSSSDDSAGSGCDSTSSSTDESSSGCSGTSDSSAEDCSVQGTSRHRKGVGVRLLVAVVALFAAARRATRKRCVRGRKEVRALREPRERRA